MGSVVILSAIVGVGVVSETMGSSALVGTTVVCSVVVILIIISSDDDV